MKTLKLALSILTVLVGCSTASAQIGSLPKKDASLREGVDAKFKVGDVWEYTTRKGEEKSTLVILKIDESSELGLIIHIAVEKIKLANCNGGPSPSTVPHMPFALKVLNESVTKKIESNHALPDFREGYDEWKEAYSKKKAGIYTIGGSGAVAVAEKTYQSALGCG